MSGPGALLSALYAHIGLRIIVLSARVVKEDIRRDIEQMILKAEFWLILSSIFWVTDQSQARVGDKLSGISSGNFLRIFLIWYIHSPLRLITSFYRNVFYQTECNFILNILVAIDTPVLSLSTAAVKWVRGKSGTYGSKYHTLALGFKLLPLLFLEWDVWKDHVLIT